MKREQGRAYLVTELRLRMDSGNLQSWAGGHGLSSKGPDSQRSRELEATSYVPMHLGVQWPRLSKTQSKGLLVLESALEVVSSRVYCAVCVLLCTK